jgi:flavin reductase (DIM6/NTAB) family NADH-FMN oxidoreductase RutF
MRERDEATEAFESFVATLDYSMLVVTAARRGRHDGCLVGFATQCSIEPQRFLVCMSKANATARLTRRARYVGVHQLGTEQEGLARLFGEQSGDWTDKFAACRWHADLYGVPVLDDAPVWLIGRTVTRVDLGDHTGLVLAPVDGSRHRDDPSLMFGAIKNLDAGHPT